MKSIPLILIHGYPLDHTLWERVTPLLGGGLTVYTPDLPGFGDNPVDPHEPSIDILADSIEQLFKLHDLSRAVIAGMSMGGYVALSFAERHPQRVAGLGLISTQAAADTDQARKGRRELIEKVRAQGVRAATGALIPKFFSPNNAPGPDLEKYPREGAEKAGVEGICWALEAMARRPDRTEWLRTFKLPAVVLHGAADQIIPVERARPLATSLAQGVFLEIPDAGHATPLEAPKEVAQALRELVRRSAEAVPLPSQSEKSNRPGITWGPTEEGL